MYSYEREKAFIFTERGQVMFLHIRDTTQRLLREAGAARLDAMIKGVGGDTWHMLACVDRLAELGEIREITNDVPAQCRVFVSGK